MTWDDDPAVRHELDLAAAGLLGELKFYVWWDEHDGPLIENIFTNFRRKMAENGWESLFVEHVIEGVRAILTNNQN